jgi:hypothetical protein
MIFCNKGVPVLDGDKAAREMAADLFRRGVDKNSSIAIAASLREAELLQRSKIYTKSEDFTVRQRAEISDSFVILMNLVLRSLYKKSNSNSISIDNVKNTIRRVLYTKREKLSPDRGDSSIGSKVGYDYVKKADKDDGSAHKIILEQLTREQLIDLIKEEGDAWKTVKAALPGVSKYLSKKNLLNTIEDYDFDGTVNTYQKEEYSKILKDENFDYFFNNAKQKYINLGMRIVDDKIIIDKSEELTQENWDNLEAFTIDGKKTASNFLKRQVASTPDSEFVKDDDGNILFDEDGNPQIEVRTNYLNLKRATDADALYDKLNQILADVYPMDTQTVLETINENQYVDANLYNFNKRLGRLVNDPSNNIEAHIVNAMVKQSLNMKTVLVSPITKAKIAGRLVRTPARPTRSFINVTDTNEGSKSKAILKDWYNNSKDKIGVLGDNESLVINEKKVQDIFSTYEQKIKKILDDAGLDGDARLSSLEQYRDEFKKPFNELLSLLGIELHPLAVEAIFDESPRLFGTHWGTVLNVFGNNVKGALVPVLRDTLLQEIDESLEDVSQYGTFGVKNPIFGSRSQGVVRKLARVENRFRDFAWAPVTANIENKNIYLFQNHTNLSITENALLNGDKASELLKSPFAAYSRILKMIDNGDLNSSNFEVILADGLKELNNDQGQQLGDLSFLDVAVHHLALYHSKKANGRIIHMLPTQADSKTQYGVQMTPFKDDFWEISIDDDGNVTFPDHTTDMDNMLLQAVYGEANRILKIQNFINTKDEDVVANHPLRDTYLEGGQHFIINHFLNRKFLEDKYGEKIADAIWNGDQLIDYKENADARLAVRKVLRDNIREKIERGFDKLQRAEVIQTLENGDVEAAYDASYKQTSIPKFDGKNRGMHEAVYGLADFIISSSIFVNESFQVFAGDPALSWKNKGDSLDQKLRATHIDIKKRMKKHTTPRIMGAFDRNNQEYNQIFLSESVVDSKLLILYEEVLGELSSYYEGIEQADAQEWVTVSERAYVMKMYGRITEQMYQEIMSTINDAIDDPSNERNYYELTEDQKKALLSAPHKPIYTGRDVFTYGGETFDSFQYIKTSSFPLFPDMTEGSSIDNLRISMENNDIQRATYESGSKMGAKNVIDINSESGFKSVDDISYSIVKNDAANRLSRENFGLQFLIPNKNDDSIKRLTQVNKIFLVDGYDLENFLYKGKEYTGRDLFEKKEEIVGELQDLLFEDLLDDLNIEAENGNLIIDYRTFERIVREEAERRGFWDEATLQALQITEDGSGFKIPLNLTPQAPTIEKLFLSLIRNHISDFRIHGKSRVQVSPHGWDNFKANPNIATLPSFSGQLRGLSAKDGEVQAAQVVIPWKFVKDGKKTDMSEYTKTDSNGNVVLDTDKISPEVLESLGSRIPNQGPNSSIPIEVIGFTDSAVDGFVIVHPEIISQMGSDFDVDKLYMYENDYLVTEDGKIEKYDNRLLKELDKKLQSDKLNGSERRKLENQRRKEKIRVLKQDYQEIIRSAFMNKESMKRVLQPLDIPYFEKIADDIKKFNEGELTVSDQTDGIQQMEYFVEERVGSGLIGIFANVNAFAGILQARPLKVHTEKLKKAGMVVPAIRSGKLLSPVTEVGDKHAISSNEFPDVSSTDVIKMLLSAAVDNTKIGALGKANMTRYVASVAAYMYLMSDGRNTFGLEQIVYFVNQPIIQIWQKEVAKIESQMSKESTYNAREKAVNSTLEKISKLTDLKLQGIKNLYNGQHKGVKAVPDTSDLKANLKNDPDWNDKLYLQEQLGMLTLFESLDKLSNTLESIRTTIFHGDTKGVGTTLMHAKRIDKLFNNYKHSSSDVLIEASRLITESKEWQSTHDNIVAGGLAIFSPVMLQPQIERAINKVEALRGTEMNPNNLITVLNETRAFINAMDSVWNESPLMKDKNIHAVRERLLFGNKEESSLAERLRDIKKTPFGKSIFFLDKLNPNVTDNALSPNLIEFVGNFGERTDSNRMLESFLEMYVSKNEEMRNLAEDLILYAFIIAGGNSHRNSFARFIPIDILENNRVVDNLRNTVMGNDDSWSNPFIVQFYQHNPFLANPVTAESAGFENIAEIPYNLANATEDQLQRLKSLVPNDAKIFAIYDSSGTKLFYNAENKGAKGATQIPLLGKAHREAYGVYEYSTNPLGRSLFDAKLLTKKPSNTTGSRKVDRVKDNENRKTKRAKAFGEWLLFFPENVTTPKIDAVDMLDHMIDNNMVDGYYSTLLPLIKNIIKRNSKFNVTIKLATLEGKAGRAIRRGNDEEIILNIGYKKSDKTRVLSHELIHSITSAIIDGNIEVNSEVNSAKSNITRLRREAANLMLEDPAAEIQEALDAIENNTFNNKEHLTAYLLSNDKEFVAGVMSEPDFQNKLGDLKTEGSDSTIFEKFAKVISNIINALAKTFGTDINNTLLSESVENTVTIMFASAQRDFKRKKKIKAKTKSKTPKPNVGQSDSAKDVFDIDPDAPNALQQIMSIPKYSGNRELAIGIREMLRKRKSESLPLGIPSDQMSDPSNFTVENAKKNIEEGIGVKDFLKTQTKEVRSTFRKLRSQIKQNCK